LVKYWDKYTKMHGQQNVKICEVSVDVMNTASEWDRIPAIYPEASHVTEWSVRLIA